MIEPNTLMTFRIRNHTAVKRLFPVQIGRDEAVPDGKQTDHGLYAAGGAGSVAGERFSGRDRRDLVSEKTDHRTAFTGVIVRCGRAVGIHIVNVPRLQPGHIQCLGHRKESPLAIVRRCGLVESVAGVAITVKRSDRSHSPIQGVFLAFQDHKPGSLAKVQSVTGSVKRSARLAVQNLQGIESVQMVSGQAFRTSGDDYIATAALDQISAEHYRVRRRGTSRGDCSHKAKTAEKVLTEQIAKGETELAYLQSVLEELARAESERDVQEIRQELVEGGYVRDSQGKKRMKLPPSRPMRFHSTEGFVIWVGRNNRQNDLLTLKQAAKGDLWLHAQKIHGSHVIIRCEGEEPPPRTLEQAAGIAAYYSQARGAGKVQVDYTMVRNVRKPSGALPGKVIYTDHKTMLAESDGALAERLKR